MSKQSSPKRRTGGRISSKVSVQLWLERCGAGAERIAAALALPAGRDLDVPCGGGRLSLALAARGHRVTGVDWSREFLAHATAAPLRRR